MLKYSFTNKSQKISAPERIKYFDSPLRSLWCQGHQIIQRGCETIRGRGGKKKRSSAAEFYIFRTFLSSLLSVKFVFI